MKRGFVLILAITLAILLPGTISPAAADTAPPPDGTWALAPLNPDYLDYLADAAAGVEVSPLMPSMRQIDPDLLPVPTPPPNLGPLPSAYDLRPLGRVTPAKESKCGTCWTDAAMGSLESFLAPGEMRDFSEAHMQLKNGLDDWKCDNGGNYEMAAKYLAAWRGPVNETDFSAYARGLGTSRPKVQKRVQNVFFLPDRKGPLDNTWIKLAVMHQGGVYSSLRKYGWGINEQFNTWYSPIPGHNHAVAIVGWDDNFDRHKFLYSHPDATEDQKIPPGNGAFIVKNNGGPDDGENGFWYVSYYDVNIGNLMAVFTAEPLGNYNRIYQYDPLGVTDFLYPGEKESPLFNASPTYAANVFTAVVDDYLAAVSFYNYDWSGEGIDYQVQVYLDPVNGPVNSSGPQATAGFSPAMEGYFTIKLPQKIPLKKGQKFSVVVAGKRREKDIGAMVPLERRRSGYSKATANAGESFVSADGENWQDVTKLMVKEYGEDKLVPLINTNVCIKAFTRPMVVVKAHQPTEIGVQSLTWTIANEGSEAVRVKPVAELYRKTRDGFRRFGRQVTGEHYLGRNGGRQNLNQGWVEAPPGETITVFSRPGALARADRVAYNYYTINGQTRAIEIGDIWKYLNHLLKDPLHVVATDPASGALVNFLGLNTISVTFDKEVKPGPSLQSVSVTSASEVKSIFNAVSGNKLLIYAATPLSSKELGGTTWTVQLPSDAVLDKQFGNPLAQDYSWSFTVTGVN